MKYIKLLLCLCLLYTPFAFAVELPPNNSWSWKHHQKMREQARLKAHLVKQINESGSSKTISAIVETRPTASKVGGVMFKRISHVAKTPGVQLIGTVAVMQLIEAIGWVMEDGTYVKYKEPEPSPSCGLNGEDCTELLKIWYVPSHTKFGTFSSALDAATYYFQNYTSPKPQEVENPQCTLNANGTATCTARIKNGYGYWVGTQSISVSQKTNPKYIGPKPPEKVTLTPALLGAAMLGSGYSDPVDSSKDVIVNNDEWTGVENSYTPDDSGIGNELAEELENKADNAPQTTDGKESSLTDSKYSNDLSSNDDANDRSWQSGDGTEGSTDSTQTTDPETGTTSNTGTFKLPAFCDWAMTMCQWYDDWTSSDKVQKDHMNKTEEHQTEEKSFWEDVKDWFDWTKEPVDEDPETEEEEPDTQGIFDRTFDTAFSLSKECPPDIPFSLETEFFSGSWNISMNWLCIIFTFLGYPLVFLSHCVGLWILYEAVVQREIKW